MSDTAGSRSLGTHQTHSNNNVFQFCAGPYSLQIDHEFVPPSALRQLRISMRGAGDCRIGRAIAIVTA